MGLFPLHVAILRNNPVSRNDMVQQLLNKGADINVKAIPVCLMLIFFYLGGGGSCKLHFQPDSMYDEKRTSLFKISKHNI